MSFKKNDKIEHLFLNNLETISKVGNWIVDFKKNTLYWSDGVYVLAGYEPGEFDVTFEKGLQVIHPDDQDRALAHMNEVLEKGIEYKIQKRFVTKSGEIKHILSKATLIRDKKGNPSQLIGVFQDVTEQVEFQNTIELNEKRFRTLVENGADAIVIIGEDGNAKYASPSIKNVLGYTDEEAMKLNLFEIIHPDYLPYIAQKWEEVMQTPGVPIQGHTSRTRHKDGSWRWLEATITNMLHDPNINGIVDNFRDVTETKQLELLLDSATTLAKVGSWELEMTNKSDDSMYWSPMTRKILEVEDEYNPSLSGGFEFYTDASKVKVQKAVDELIKSGKEFDHELEVTTAQGNNRWIRCIGKSDREGDQCLRIYGSYQDITEQKLTELETVKANQEKNEILETIGEAFFAMDRSWKVLYWNKNAELLLGVKKEDIVGKIVWDEFPEAVQLKFFPAYNEAFETQKATHFEEFYHPVEKWLEVNAYPNNDRLSIFFKDITDKKLTEEQIRLSNERFEKVASATNDAIWDYDVLTDRLFWGNGYLTQFGYDPEIVKPTFNFLVNLIHPEDRERITAKIQQYMTDGESTHWFEEYRFQKSDGNYALIIDRGIFIRNQHGMVIRVVGAMTDISYRKEYEESLMTLNAQLEDQKQDLIESNRELEQFAYITSHDLQEPIRMIHSFLSLLEKRYGDQLDDKAKQYIHFATDGAIRMRQIILDLLEFSRVGKYDDKIKPVNLIHVVQEVLDAHRNRIKETRATVKFEGLPTILAIESPLTQVFHNLINNALKYHHKDRNPEILIQAKDLGKEWEFKISDNGMGIESEYLEKIFVIFQRLHTREQIDGTGMGLAIVKKVVEHMGGKIWATSEVGVGSTFYFTLPKLNKARLKKAKIN